MESPGRDPGTQTVANTMRRTTDNGQNARALVALRSMVVETNFSIKAQKDTPP